MLTALSVYNGQSTIFYVIFFFWCNELINIIVDRIFGDRNSSTFSAKESRHFFTGALFMMMIYGVFIIVFFAVIANWNNPDLVIINLQILFFKNWFFNTNLLLVLINRLYLHWKKEPIKQSFGGFTGNMLVLHISIILGGLLMFFVVKKYPQTFSPENLWGSVVIILPFLLLKMGMQYWMRPVKPTQ